MAPVRSSPLSEMKKSRLFSLVQASFTILNSVHVGSPFIFTAMMAIHCPSGQARAGHSSSISALLNPHDEPVC